jgi:molecular chaperone GrpE
MKIQLKAVMESLNDKDTIIEIPITTETPAAAGSADEPISEPPIAEPQTNQSAEPALALADPLQECEDKFKRLAADFANYKRRAEAERNELLDLLEARLLAGILSIYDDFCRLSQHTAEVNDQLAQGFKAVQTKWQAWLANENVEVLDPGGQAFDPRRHDALMQQAVTNAEQDGKVVLVIERGYKRREKVLRHAKVIVGHFEAAASSPEAVEQETPEIPQEEQEVQAEIG